ncbi:ATP-binding protein [Candidatus Woesearchaeota archaeon]|nr:ATP-binding protein [Candidatus Woesearchaeota archaeon]
MRTYDLPLVDWIRIGLHRQTLEQVVQAIEHGKPLGELGQPNPINVKYIEKILREEIAKQFSHPERPLLEVVLNAIDARPSSFADDYTIQVQLSRKKFAARDNGIGMGVDEILRLLIIPFNTDKSGIEEIGRFGVGFLSTFNYCLHEPGNSTVLVETKRKEGGGYAALFYSTSGEIKDLRLRLQRMHRTRPGTAVRIRRHLGARSLLQMYLKERLKGVPSYHARIVVDGKQINKDSNEKWYAAPVELNIKGNVITQPIGFRIDRDDPNHITLSSQGVAVKHSLSQYGGAIISFPSGIQVVEGRDDFKMDKNYRRGIAAAFQAIEKYIQAQERTEEFVGSMASFLPALMSAFKIMKLKDVPNIDGIVAALMPGKRYALTNEQLQTFSPFLGNTVRELSFVTSPDGCAYWREIFGHDLTVVADLLKPKEIITPEAFEQRAGEDSSFYPNLRLLAREAKNASFTGIVLVDVLPPQNPVMVYNNVLYINASHRYVQGPFNPLKVYSIISGYYGLADVARVMRYYRPEQAEATIQSLTAHLHGRPAIVYGGKSR